MTDTPQGRDEIDALKARLAEAEETIRAIYCGEVDALLVSTPEGDRVFTLQGAERPYRLLVESMNEGAMTLTSDETINYCNSRIAEMVAHPMEHLVGSSWHSMLPAEEHDSFRSLLQSAAPGGKGEFTLITSDRSKIPVQISVRTMATEDSNAFAVLMTDISARKAVEAELNKANQELKRRAARLRESVLELESFSYSIAHDMRAPLRAMQGFAALLMEDCGDQVGDQGRDYVRRIMTSANRLDHLIQDVLQYNRMVKMELKLEPVNLGKLVYEIIESYPILQSSSASISIVEPLPTVLGNQAALTQCISNLLSNAIKFVPPGGVPEIKIWAESRGRWFRICFEDHGIGIEKEALNRIFKMFQRLNSTNTYEGTGIGLTIVRKAVERMGGKIGVESEPGQGSRFWLDLKKPEINEA